MTAAATAATVSDRRMRGPSPAIGRAGVDPRPATSAGREAALRTDDDRGRRRDLGQPLRHRDARRAATDPLVIAGRAAPAQRSRGTMPRSDCSAASRAIVRSRSSRRGGSSRTIDRSVTDELERGDADLGRMLDDLLQPIALQERLHDRQPMPRLAATPGADPRRPRGAHRAGRSPRPSPGSSTSRSPSRRRRTRSDLALDRGRQRKPVAGHLRRLDEEAMERHAGASSRSATHSPSSRRSLDGRPAPASRRSPRRRDP